MGAVIIQAIIQGIGEFIPISSTAHMIAFHKIYGFPLDLFTKVFFHLGTLFVLVVYFWREIFSMACGFFSLLPLKRTKTKEQQQGFKLLGKVVIATIPCVIAGYYVHKHMHDQGDVLALIGWSSIVFALILFVVDRSSPNFKKLEHLKPIEALMIGITQMLGFIPGVSRLGSTLIAGRILGLKRTEAARFSFLVSIPTVIGAFVLVFFSSPHLPLIFSASMTNAFAIILILGFVTLFLFMRYIRTHTLMIFALYRFIFGLFVLYFTYA